MLLANRRPDRLRTDFALHAPTADELVTCRGLLEREATSKLTLMPTHHIDEFGDLNGFRFDCNGSAPGSSLPITRRMFFGHTAVECTAREAEILALMSDPAQNKARMAEFLHETERLCTRPALLDCIPDNSDAMTSHGVLQGTDLRSVDCKAWTPEVPECIGIYHAYLRGFNRDVRAHKMFIVCSGGLEKASDAFCNLMIDVGAKWTAKEVADSEEVWWLRKACTRARCRLIYSLAKAYHLSIPAFQDIQAHEDACDMATHCTDTLEHDLSFQDGIVSVHNSCCDTTRPFNGILTRMHPAEGYWLFKGTPRGSGFGSIFGDRRVCGAFPTSQPRVKRPSSVTISPSEYVIRLRSKPTPERYACFDEAHFKNLESMQWTRDNGHVELMPIVVGVQ